MNSNLLIYYVFRLIKDGHEWQYKNLNGKGEKPKYFFSFMQFVALCISALFCICVPEGLTSNATDHILTCLSIMVALFLSLIIVIFDKSKEIKSSNSKNNKTNDISVKSVSPLKRLHLWNFFYQFNALTSYAILLSISVIILIFIGLMFDMSMDISKYKFIPYNLWNRENILMFIDGTFIISIRFCIIYFLLDFFIICLYAVCSIYQYIRLDFLGNRPDTQVYNEEEITATFKREYGFDIGTIKKIIFIILFIILGFVSYKLL